MPRRILTAAALSVAALMTGAGGAPSLQIAVIGDSIANNYCSGLKNTVAEREDITLTCLAKPSTGLTRDDVYDWNAELPAQIAGQHFDLAIVSMGANDAQNMTLPGAIAKFGSGDWRHAYESRVDAMIDQLETTGAQIVWVGLPNVRSQQFAGKLSFINEIYADRAADHGATFLPMWDRTSDRRGYTPRLAVHGGRPKDARQADGIHFNLWGERVVACAIATELSLAPGC